MDRVYSRCITCGLAIVPPIVFSTIRSTRSGWSIASCAVTQPPSDSPVKDAFSTPIASRKAITCSM